MGFRWLLLAVLLSSRVGLGLQLLLRRGLGKKDQGRRGLFGVRPKLGGVAELGSEIWAKIRPNFRPNPNPVQNSNPDPIP